LSAPALPPDFETWTFAGGSSAARRDVAGAVREALAASGSLYRWAAAQPGRREFTGRGAAFGVTLGGQSAVVRHVRHGGRDLTAREIEPRSAELWVAADVEGPGRVGLGLGEKRRHEPGQVVGPTDAARKIGERHQGERRHARDLGCPVPVELEARAQVRSAGR